MAVADCIGNPQRTSDLFGRIPSACASRFGLVDRISMVTCRSKPETRSPLTLTPKPRLLFRLRIDPSHCWIKHPCTVSALHAVPMSKQSSIDDIEEAIGSSAFRDFRV